MTPGSFKNLSTNYVFTNHNMYKEDLALNNLQWLTCYKNPTKPNQTWKRRTNNDLNLIFSTINILILDDFVPFSTFHNTFLCNHLHKGCFQ